MYARYIPPKKSQQTSAALEGLPLGSRQDDTAKLDKKSRIQECDSLNCERGDKSTPEKRHNRKRQTPDDGPCNVDMPAKKQKRDKPRIGKGKKKEDTTAQEIDHEENALDKRTSSILSKRDHSLQLAAAAAADQQVHEASEFEDEEHAAQEVMVVHPIGPLPQPRQVAAETSAPTYQTLPDWLQDPYRILPDQESTFEHLGLDDAVCKRFRSMGFENPFPVQATAAELLPPILPWRINFHRDCRDVLISAGTGSGKTLAYALPMVRDLCKFPDTALRGVVVVPTRDLVDQVSRVLNVCADAFAQKKEFKSRVKIGTAVGNQSIAKEHVALIERRMDYVDGMTQIVTDEEWHTKQNKLARERFGDELPIRGYDWRYHSKVDIVVGTLDRLFEHRLFTKGFTFDQCRWIVVDEADKMLPEPNSFDTFLMHFFLPNDPAKTVHLRKVLVGATISGNMNLLSSMKLRHPVMVVLGTDESSARLPVTLRESYVRVLEDDVKPLYLLELLEQMHSSTERGASSDPSHATTLVFVRENLNVSRLKFLVSQLQPSLESATGTLTSKMHTSERKRVVSALKNRRLRMVIASDIAARGLDVEGLNHVVNYDVPNSGENYVHRVGRTARAGQDGMAWSLVTNKEMAWFKREILGQQDSKRERKGLKILRSHDIKPTTLPIHQGVPDCLRSQYKTALACLEHAVLGE